MHLSCWDDIVEDRVKIFPRERRIFEKIMHTVEKYHCDKELDELAHKAADLIIKSEKIVCFTGAGISAATGIPTYRGSEGIDTLADLCVESKNNKVVLLDGTDDDDDNDEGIDYTKLEPTFAHYSLAKMERMNKLQGCFTQNCDDLHEKSGISSKIMSDLHGNVFKEYCEKCLKEYKREYCVDLYSTDCWKENYAKKCEACGWNHYTGRRCGIKKCRGKFCFFVFI